MAAVAYILDFFPSGKYVALDLEEATDIIIREMATQRSCNIEKARCYYEEDEEETQEEE